MDELRKVWLEDKEHPYTVLTQMQAQGKTKDLDSVRKFGILLGCKVVEMHMTDKNSCSAFIKKLQKMHHCGICEMPFDKPAGNVRIIGVLDKSDNLLITSTFPDPDGFIDIEDHSLAHALLAGFLDGLELVLSVKRICERIF